MIKGKKASEKYLSIWWFLCLAIIGGAIVIGVWIFYSAEVDIKQLDADILAGKLTNCLVEAGELNSHKIGDDIFDICYLNKNILANNGGNYYFEIAVYDIEICKEDIDNIEKCIPEVQKNFGNVHLKTFDCKFREKGSGKYLGKCSERKIYAIENGKIKLIYLLAAASQQGGNREVVQ